MPIRDLLVCEASIECIPYSYDIISISIGVRLSQETKNLLTYVRKLKNLVSTWTLTDERFCSCIPMSVRPMIIDPESHPMPIVGSIRDPTLAHPMITLRPILCPPYDHHEAYLMPILCPIWSQSYDHLEPHPMPYLYPPWGPSDARMKRLLWQVEYGRILKRDRRQMRIWWLFSSSLYVAVYVTGPLKPSLMYEKNSKRE